jgi:hypothetical protein
MANQFETSFIPQQPLLKVEGVSHRKESINFSVVFSIIILIASGVIAGGLYFYRTQVDNRIHQAQKDLAEAEKYFSIDEIHKYQQANMRLSVAKTLVHQHTINSVILDFLEGSTAVNVGLTSFGAVKDGTGYHVSLNGQAPSYSGVYFQVEKWRAMQPTVRGVTMGSLGLDEKNGIVTFSLVLDIDPSYLEFSSVLQRNGSVSAPIPEAKVDIQSTTTPSL